MYDRFIQSAVISGKSGSMMYNYSYHLAKIAIHQDCVPHLIAKEDIDAYLFMLTQRPNSLSDSYFKHAIHSLKYLYKLYDLKDKHASLPKLRHQRKLPIVLSRNEVKRVIAAANAGRQHILILLLYGCGLRCGEASKVRLVDVDFDRKTLFVRNGKGGRQRYVPLSMLLMDAIVAFLRDNNPVEYLLERSVQYTRLPDNSLSTNSMSASVRHIFRKAKIMKKVSAHSLRHTFATHLLEDGLDIVTIKELLGHANIATTMLYLHVAQCDRSRAFSPLDTLYRRRIEFDVFPGFANQMLPMQKSLFLAEFN